MVYTRQSNWHKVFEMVVMRHCTMALRRNTFEWQTWNTFTIVNEAFWGGKEHSFMWSIVEYVIQDTVNYDRYSTNMTTTKYLLYRCVFHGVQVMNTCWIVLIVFKENKNTTISIGRTLPLNKYYCRCPIWDVYGQYIPLYSKSTVICHRILLTL